MEGGDIREVRVARAGVHHAPHASRACSMTVAPYPPGKLPAGRPRDAVVYWGSATDPGHRHAEAWWIEFYARELLLYFPAHSGRVLECGCGTGVFYPYFKDRCESYVGIDFSESMLRE